VHISETPGFDVQSMRLRERSGKLRGDAFFGPFVPDTEGERVAIFDGTTHLAYMSRTRQLGISTRSTEPFVLTIEDPLCATYRWLMTLPLLSWSQAKSQAKWLDAASRATLLPPSTVQGKACHSLRIEGGEGAVGCWINLEIAKDLHLPLKWTESQPDGFVNQEILVREWKEYPCEEGVVVLPMVVDRISRLPNTKKETKTTITVEPASVRINPEIGEDVFTIAESRAKEVWNEQTRERVYPQTGVVHKVNEDGSFEVSSRPVASRSFWQSWTFWGVALIAIALGGLFFRYRQT